MSSAFHLLAACLVLGAPRRCSAEVETAGGSPRTEFARMNSELLAINSMASLLDWKLAVEPSDDLRGRRLELAEVRSKWRKVRCEELNGLYDGFSGRNGAELRGLYLLCRGPVYDAAQTKELSSILTRLRDVYATSRVCMKNGTCLAGEPELERLMATSREPETLLWAWTEWRNAVGEPSRDLYARMVQLLNAGARGNGYAEIGECWREELEVRELEKLAESLYAEVRPLYEALHAFVRHRLSLRYGSDVISRHGSIPAHLLGNMWGQNWASLVDLVVDADGDSVAEGFRRKNYSAIELTKKAEDFYVSIGFEPMTEKFWKNSKFDNRNGSLCHGSAANMFRDDDFRVILCAGSTAEDFRVVHHEMGHVQYYMQYRHQLPIFQDGVNSGFQEAVGDSVMYGVMTPAHLQRLGLVQEVDEASGFDLKLLLYQALNKLPQIPFALALEKWRWGVFRGEITPGDYNRGWWFLREKYQGLKPPISRGEEYFDPAAKFHISDNTPYIRYFISSFLQMQIFESLCKGAIFGRDKLNATLPMPLHKCDIYGSREGTEKLRAMMSLGRSIHWSRALRMVTGDDEYSARSLLRYYEPLHAWLLREIERSNITVGW